MATMGSRPRMPTERIPTAVPLHDRDFGGEAEPPCVILHGMLGSSRNWQTVGRDLAAVRRTFALDLRNHGSSPQAAEMTYPAMAADVLAWMEGRGLGAADLVGHSLGGKVAMLLACRRPERVRRLVVVDIAPKPYDWPARRVEFAAMKGLDLATLKSRAEAEARLEKDIPSWAMRKFLVSSLERGPAGWRWQFNLPVLSSALSELEGNPLADGDRYDGPALFVVGGKSDYVRPGDGETIRAHFPSARIETLAGAGHNPHIDAREAFVAAVGPA
jgi:esterase